MNLLDTYEYRIASLTELSGHVWQIYLEPLKLAINYQAGQYVMLLDPQGEFVPFSIANAPASSSQLEIHIRFLPNDPITAPLLSMLKQEKQITVKGPFGKAFYNKKLNPILILAAGTGFAPAKAILEQYFADQGKNPIHLYWGVRSRQDFYMNELPEKWVAENKNFLYTPVLSKADASWEGKIGRLPETVVENYSDLAGYAAYLFGPKIMAECAQQLLLSHGLKPENLFSDML